MQHLFKPNTIKSVILILLLALIVKIVWLFVSLAFFDARGIEYTKSSKVKSLYYRTKFANNKQRPKESKKVIMSDISSFKLLGIYRSDDLVVVIVSKAGKSSVLVKGDDIDGYLLDDATVNEAIFLRNGKKYRLRLMKLSSSVEEETPRYLPAKTDHNTIISKKKREKPEGEIVEDGDIRTIDKSLISHYGKNLNDIWKNIGIKEVRDGRKIKGFKVNFVKRGSDFSKLGLKRGDIIKSLNGEELDNYSRAFEFYKNINTVENLTLTIQRGEEEMELNYEIN